MQAPLSGAAGQVDPDPAGGERRPRREARWTPRVQLTAPPASGLVRRRLLDILDQRDSRLFFLTAPPGSGKTTLVAQYADLVRRSRTGHEVAWYHADETDTSAAAVARHLSAAISLAHGLDEPDDADPDTLFTLLESTNVTVVVDDAHHLAGTPAEHLLARAVAVSPRNVRFVVVGTRAPGVGFARHLLGAGTRTLGEQDLRLRSWEITELFDRHYGEPLPSADTERLRRDTDGWVAGLHMFHLATAGRPLSERRRLVRSPWIRGRLVRMYLAATLFDRLPSDIDDFVVRTSPFGILEPGLCDVLLGRHDSALVLDDLVERQLFTSRLDDAAGTYRYHPVLQAHLHGLLRERMGTQNASRWFARAGQMLECAGHPTQALRAYVQAGTLEAARRVLRTHGPRLVADPAFPDEAFAIDDPWIGIARAHRLLHAGDLLGAVDAYRDVERRAAHTPVAESARRDRTSAEVWLPGASLPQGHPGGSAWPGLLRMAVRDQSWTHHQATGAEPGTAFVAATTALLQGEPRLAMRIADRIDAQGEGVLPLATQLLRQVANIWLGSNSASSASLEALAAEAERTGEPWLARLTRAVSGLAGGDPTDVMSCWEECRDANDHWGAMAVALTAGLSQLQAGHDASRLLEDAADAAHRLQAGAVEAWARALLALALARSGAATAELEAHRAEACARSVGVPAARAVAFQALAFVADDGAPEFRVLAETSAAEHGLPLARLAPPVHHDPAPAPDVGLRVNVECFGGFRIAVGGQDLDLSRVRPRARAMLRMLACYAGQPVHEERLLDALWPRMAVAAGRRNLHVAVSALRKALEPAAIRGRSRLLRRTGTAYVLALPPGSRADVVEFRAAVGVWRGVRDRAVEPARSALRAVLASYGGELLPEDGPVDWVVVERETLRADVARAAVTLAELELAHHDGMAAADAAEYAVRVDPFRDQAWRALLAAHELSGDAAATAQTRQRYAVMLGELGIAAEAASA